MKQVLTNPPFLLNWGTPTNNLDLISDQILEPVCLRDTTIHLIFEYDEAQIMEL